MEKFAKVKVRSTDVAPLLQFAVEVVVTLKDALENLPAIEPSSKPEVIVVFLYDTHGDCFYVRFADVLAVNAHILREEENLEEDMYNPLKKVLIHLR